MPGIRQALAARRGRLVAVSPIVQGATLKGPADKLMLALGYEVSALGVAHYYRELLDGFILDALDQAMQERARRLGIEVRAPVSLGQCRWVTAARIRRLVTT